MDRRESQITPPNQGRNEPPTNIRAKGRDPQDRGAEAEFG